MKTRKQYFGQSMVELVMAISIFAIIGSSIMVLVLDAFNMEREGKEDTQALSFAEEGIEAMRAVRDRAWNKLRFPQGQISINGGAWAYNNNPSPETIGRFNRAITVSDVCRDINGNQVSCPGLYADAHTKKVTTAVSWTQISGAVRSVQQTMFLTNWDAVAWKENIKTDFDDGVLFNNTVSTTTIGDGSGAVILVTQ